MTDDRPLRVLQSEHHDAREEAIRAEEAARLAAGKAVRLREQLAEAERETAATRSTAAAAWVREERTWTAWHEKLLADRAKEQERRACV